MPNFVDESSELKGDYLSTGMFLHGISRPASWARQHLTVMLLLAALFGWRFTATALGVLALCYFAWQGHYSGLSDIPGPKLAKYSSLFRFFVVYRGEAPQRYRELHAKYGSIVRTGPNHVSVSDPAMIPVIYGIGRKFNKVRHLIP